MTPRERFLGLLKNDILKLDLTELKRHAIFRDLRPRSQPNARVFTRTRQPHTGRGFAGHSDNTRRTSRAGLSQDNRLT